MMVVAVVVIQCYDDGVGDSIVMVVVVQRCDDGVGDAVV